MGKDEKKRDKSKSSEKDKKRLKDVKPSSKDKKKVKSDKSASKSKQKGKDEKPSTKQKQKDKKGKDSSKDKLPAKGKEESRNRGERTKTEDRSEKKSRRREHRRRRQDEGSPRGSSSSQKDRRERRRERIRKLSETLEKQGAELQEVKVDSGDKEKPIETYQYVQRDSYYEEVADEEEVDARHLDLSRASFAQDGSELVTVQLIGKSFLRALKPITIFGRLAGRYPMSHTVTPEGLVIFQLQYRSPYVLALLVSNILCTILFCMGSIVSFCLWMNVPIGIDFANKDNYANRYLKKYRLDGGNIQTEQAEKVELWLRNRPERYLFDRHVAMFIWVWSRLLHSVISGWRILAHGRQLEEYYNFWMRSMYTMKMDVTKGASNRVYLLLGLIAGYQIGSLILVVLQILPTTTGLPTVVATILVRPFYGDFMDIIYKDRKRCFHAPPCYPKVFTISREVATIILAFATTIGTFYGVWFALMCKCLKNGFAIWNGRLYSILLASRDARQSRSGRTTFTLLFKDHCTLLDLLEATDRIFSGIIESFFGLSVLSYCILIHFTTRTGRSGYSESQAKKEDYFVRPNDWIAGFIVLVVDTFILLITLHGAAEVGEEALTGLEIIRRRSLLGRKSDSELYFLMSLFGSYTSYKPMALSAAGYFTCNRQFILGILGTILAYFTLLVQFDPKLDFQRELGDTPRNFIQQFICLAEKSRFGFARPECNFDNSIN